MKKINLITGIVIFTLLISNAFAQESVNSSAGQAEGSGGSVNYSVGQIFFNTSTTTTGSMTEGVQQPYEISAVTSIDEATEITLVVSAYPNPVTDTDHLILEVDKYNTENLHYQLFDVNGRMVGNGKVIGSQTIINMTGLAGAIYFLRVLDKQKEIKTFRILKF